MNKAVPLPSTQLPRFQFMQIFSFDNFFWVEGNKYNEQWYLLKNDNSKKN